MSGRFPCLKLSVTLRDLFWVVLLAAGLTAWTVQHSRTAREISRLKEEALFILKVRPSPPNPEQRDRLAAIRKFRGYSDEELDQRLDRLLATGSHFRDPIDAAFATEYEPCLLEMARRGLAAQLKEHFRRLMARPRASAWDYPRNLELLAALRRAQRQPDPLRITVSAAKPRWWWNEDDGVLLGAKITNVDVGQESPLLLEGGDYRGGLRERWQLELADLHGVVIDQSNFRPLHGGGLGSQWPLEPGATGKWENEFDIRRYVAPPRSGHYYLRAHYHNEVGIAGEPELAGLIVFSSEPIPVTVKNPLDRPIEWFPLEARPPAAILAVAILLLATGARWSGRWLPRTAWRDLAWCVVLAAVALGWYVDQRRQTHAISRLHPDWKAPWTLHLGHGEPGV